jgi:hypothetical protein
VIWAEYVLDIPKSLEQRRVETSEQYRKEKDKIYKRKKREAKKKCTNTKQQ